MNKDASQTHHPSPITHHENLPGITHVVRLSRTGSTQDLAKGLALKNFPEGTLVWADRQTKGRGRLSRKWHSQKGGLYFTLLLRPRVAPTGLSDLSLISAEMISNTLHRLTGLSTQVKPPNDVLASAAAAGPYKKVCGILAEACGDGEKTDWVLLGIGINLNNAVPQQLDKASSLKHLLRKKLEPEAVLRAVLKDFWEIYRVWNASPSHVHKPPI